MEELERAQERLDNIRGVKPILGGLRTISLGSWQAALKRRGVVQQYAERLRRMLPALVPHLQPKRGILARLRGRSSLPIPLLPGRRETERKEDSRPKQVVILVVGSERGLCGRFNVAAIERAERYLREQSVQGVDPTLTVLGSRAQRISKRRDHEPAWTKKLSVTRLPQLSLAFELTRAWLSRYEERELDAVDVVYNAYRGTGTYEPSVARLIPPSLSEDESVGETAPPEARLWPPPIVETDPMSLYATVVEQWAAVQLYGLLLDSAAAEHATRFQLMESATQNAERLIEELTLVIQTARQQEITQEMTELAAGAGLIGRAQES